MPGTCSSKFDVKKQKKDLKIEENRKKGKAVMNKKLTLNQMNGYGIGYLQGNKAKTLSKVGLHQTDAKNRQKTMKLTAFLNLESEGVYA